MGKLEDDRRYYERHKAEISERRRARYRADPEHERALARERVRRHRERRRSTPEGREQLREKKREQHRRRRERIRNMIREKKATGCVDCGRDDLPPEVLDLDHVHGDREFSLAKASTMGIARIKAELEKCEVRCPTCHALRHFRERANGFGRNC